MFTGIVEEIGAVTAVAPSGDGVRLTVRAPKAVSDAGHGDSIAVSGVCLTVVEIVDEGEGDGSGPLKGDIKQTGRYTVTVSLLRTDVDHIFVKVPLVVEG